MTDFEPAEKDLSALSDIELARKIASTYEAWPGHESWNFDYVEELVRRAGLEEEWKDTGYDFGSVVYRAAERLGVENKMDKYAPYERPAYYAEMSDAELAKKIADSDVWIPEDVADLAWRAGLWEALQDADTFESVAFQAAEKLGVEIV